MIYYKDNELLIRTIQVTDAKIICEEEIAQGWHQTEEKYQMRIADNKSRVQLFVGILTDFSMVSGK